MAADVSFESSFLSDLKRLAVYREDYAQGVRSLVRDYLAVDGAVPRMFEPHRLDNRRKHLSGFTECHAESDVLVVYSVNSKRRFADTVRLMRVSSLKRRVNAYQNPSQ